MLVAFSGLLVDGLAKDVSRSSQYYIIQAIAVGCLPPQTRRSFAVLENRN